MRVWLSREGDVVPHLKRDSSRGPGAAQAPAGSCGAGFSGMLAKLRTTPGSSGNAKESRPELLCCCACTSLQSTKSLHTRWRLYNAKSRSFCVPEG